MKDEISALLKKYWSIVMESATLEMCYQGINWMNIYHVIYYDKVLLRETENREFRYSISSFKIFCLKLCSLRTHELGFFFPNKYYYE